MQKRGQITLFLVLGVLTLAAVGLSYLYLKNSRDQGTASVDIRQSADNAEIVKAYASNCLKRTGESALFKVGEHGGFIDPRGNEEYGDPGISTSYPTALFLGKILPYYALDYYPYIPSLESINKKLANYIAVEFEKCFDSSTFKDIGIEIQKPVVDYRAAGFDFGKTPVKIDVSLNENDISIFLKYPLVIKQDDAITTIDSFRAQFPIRLKLLYESSVQIVENAKNLQPYMYNLTNDCPAYDRNGLTNVYLKPSDDGADRIVQFVDFSTYGQHYAKSYIFQFALKGVNITGYCSG